MNKNGVAILGSNLTNNIVITIRKTAIKVAMADNVCQASPIPNSNSYPVLSPIKLPKQDLPKLLKGFKFGGLDINGLLPHLDQLKMPFLDY